MHVIKYKQGYCSPNVALVVKLNKYRQAQILTPAGLQSANIQQWNKYWSAVQSNAQIALLPENCSDYQLYTVDLQALTKLYAKVDDKVYDVFDGYYDIINAMQSLPMTDHYVDDKLQMNVLVGNAGRLVQPTLQLNQNARLYYASSGVVSSRLINIAIRTYDTPEFFEQLPVYATMQEDDSQIDSFVSQQVVLHPAATYDTSDYTFVRQSIGQSFRLRKLRNLQLSLTARSYGQSQTLLANAGLDQLRQFADILDVYEDDQWVTISFAYNANKVYNVIANTIVTSVDSIPANSIKVVTADMLSHAKLSNVLVNDAYIVSSDKQYTYKLPEVTTTVRSKRVQLSNWHTDNYKYDTYANGLPKHAFDNKNLGCWLGMSYKMQKLQTSEMTKTASTTTQLSTLYGTAEHSYIANLDANVVIPDAFKLPYAMQGSASMTAETELCINLQYLDLPSIIDGIVDFNNVRYTFPTKQYDGRRFATIVVTTSQRSLHRKQQLIETTCYVALLAYVCIDSLQTEYLPDYWYNTHATYMLPALLFGNNAFCTVSVSPSNLRLSLPII